MPHDPEYTIETMGEDLFRCIEGYEVPSVFGTLRLIKACWNGRMVKIKSYHIT